MKSKEYQRVLRELNPAQRKAVKAIEGPVMVIAGPGTGKTHVLAARIAHILQKTDTPPYSILALTFTDSAAKNMRDRIVQMIGTSGYYVNISTFHSFCSDVISSYPEYFPIDRGSEPLSELERYEIYELILNILPLNILKPINRPLFYLPDIVQAISNLKREGIFPKDFNKIVTKEFQMKNSKLTKTEKAKQEKNKKKNKELVKIYFEYQKQLRKRLKYDFDDMIALIVEAFKNNELLLREYQEKLHYFLVDEYQDTNSSQNIVVELLASYWGEKANVFVVGDPHQSIYRFQGASIENMVGFIKKFKEAEVITLDIGYRCPQLVYDAAHTIISHNTLTGPDTTSRVKDGSAKGISTDLMDSVNKKLTSVKSKGMQVSLSTLPSQMLETVFVVEKIKDLIAQGVAKEEIAILYRNNADALEIQEMLDKWNIAYEIDGGGNILEDESIRQLLQLMKVINDVKLGQESLELFEIMSYDWIDVDNILAMKIARAAGKSKLAIVDLIQKGYKIFEKYHGTHEVTHIEFHAAEQLLFNIQKWATDDSKMIFTAWFEMIIQESGYLHWLLKQPTKIELLTNINSLFREVKSLVQDNHAMKLNDFLEAVLTMQEHRIRLSAEDLNVDKGAVHLSTVHRAKGREWEHVFLIHCIDGKWGNARKRELIPLPKDLLKNTDLSKKERNEDERRLFYVALSRTKNQMHISYPETLISDHRSRNVIGSMFIEEMNKKHIFLEKTEDIEAEASKYLERILQPREASQVTISEREFFNRIVSNLKLSVTALNTYLRDTNEFIQNVLLRVPRAKPEPMAFGTAVHYALEKMYKARIQNSEFRIQELLSAFEKSLKKELLHSDDFNRRLKHGKDVLKKYHDTYANDDVKPLFIERFFGFGFSKTFLGDIPLTGRIDRVDWVDQKARTVRVIDYKTGKARSHNDIEGKTVASYLSPRELELPEGIRGPYKRQLLFYKLLTELDQTFIPKVAEGVFDFVEPNKQTGKLVQRHVELLDDDVNELKQLIRIVMKEIRELKFLE